MHINNIMRQRFRLTKLFKAFIGTFFLASFLSFLYPSETGALSNNCDFHQVVDSNGQERTTFTNNETLVVIGRECTGTIPYTQAEITFTEQGGGNVFTGTAQILGGTYSFPINTNQLNPSQLPANYEISIFVETTTNINIQIIEPNAGNPPTDPNACNSFTSNPNPVTVGDTVTLSGGGCPSGVNVQQLNFYNSGTLLSTHSPVHMNGNSFSTSLNSGFIGGPGVYDVGVVFSNGSEWIVPNAVRIIDPITITPPDGPIPAEYIPCGSTDEPEYHSRRPYQASPCNPNLEELDLYCANDLITSETFKVTPEQADSCEQSNGGLLCHYSFSSVLEVTVELPDAELPIVGNTQLVPNQVNGGRPIPEKLSYARRVNEYLTWWLDGVPWKAEEELLDPDEIDIEYPEKHLITYGGPIRKLFPQILQRKSRSDRQGQTSRGLLHNQIYICTSGGNQVPCRYNPSTGRYEIVDTRGTTDPSDDVTYGLSPTRILEGTPESPWMPFTSTEDRLGSIYANIADSTPQPTVEEGNEVTITNYDFIPENDTDLLYFAHMEEAVSLVDLLQRTYSPLEIPRGGPHTSEPASYYNTYRCDLKDVRWNSGDDLFGELGPREGPDGNLTPVTSSTGSETYGENISGLVSYSGNFQCFFDNAVEDRNACIHNCSTDITQCDPENNDLIPDPFPDCRSYCENVVCPETTCEVEALTATSLYTETPKAEELWDRTVVGNASLLRRMFPALGRFGEILKDYPAVTSARYSAVKAPGGSSFTSSSTVGTYAGDPSEQDPGSNAELYIPHLGGIKVLSMDLMQDMLRPRKLGSGYLENGIPPGSGGSCSIGTGNCAPENLTPPWASGDAVNASIICNRESGGLWNNANTSCTNGGTYDFSIGLFQINLAPLNAYFLDPPRLRSRCEVWGFPNAFTTEQKDNLYPNTTFCEIPDDGTDCSDLIPYSGPCNQDLRGCIQYVLDNQLDLAYDISNKGTSWCAWSAAGPAACNLCSQ